ncbi:MAG: tyrosine--tRNA ligase, partial [Phycisphaerae bacterium]
EQLATLVRGCERVYTEQELRDKLARSSQRSRPLRIKLGMDPTAPDIHLGHTVVLRKMRQFQDLGHKAVLIIGDYTAMVGDPSDKSRTRPMLSRQQVQRNAETYLAQAGKVLDTRPERLEIRHNSEWLESLRLADALRLASKMTVARMLERDTFDRRYKAGVEIYIHEFLYPLLQARDSVAVEADVELGGTDQTFNNLVGRDLQRDAGQEPQVVMILPILVGLDGTEKMSKSLGNAIAITDGPHDMFGKTMRLPDHCMPNYFELLTDLPADQIQALCDPARTHPMQAKKQLAWQIVATLHSPEAADRARSEWERLHQKSASPDLPGGLVVPEGTPQVTIPPALIRDGRVRAVDLIVHCGFAESRSQARRLIDESGVRLNGQVIDDANAALVVRSGDVLQRGKRRFARLEVSR